MAQQLFRTYSHNGLVRILGVRNAVGTVANFHAAVEEVEAAVKRVIKKAAPVHRDTARGLAPVRTGRLRRSIVFQLSPGGLTYTVFPDPDVFAAEGQVYYPVFVEFGTVKMTPRPYLLPSMRIMEPIVRQDVQRAVTRAVNRVRRKAAAA